MAPVSVLFIHPLPVCKLDCLSSALLQSQCLHAVTAAWYRPCCFSLWENTSFPTCLLALALQNVMIWVLCMFSSGFVIPLRTGSYGRKRESTTCTICNPWVPNGTLPQRPGVPPMSNKLWWFLLLSLLLPKPTMRHQTLSILSTRYNASQEPHCLV